MSRYRKAIAAVVTAVVACLAAFNIDVDPEVQSTIITVATALAVLVVPNEPDHAR